MLIYGVIYMYMHCKIVQILTYENGLSSFHCLYGTFMFMDSFKIIAFKNIQRYMSDCPNLEWHMLKLFLYIRTTSTYNCRIYDQIYFTYPSGWMLSLQALCMHPCHEEHREQTKPSGLNWNKIIDQINSTYVFIYR